MASTMQIIAFLVHAVLFAYALLLAVAYPNLLDNQTYTYILYTLLASLLLHGGYTVGSSGSKESEK